LERDSFSSFRSHRFVIWEISGWFGDQTPISACPHRCTRKSALREGRRENAHSCVHALTRACTRESSKRQQHTHARANLRSNARVSQSRIADFSHTRFLDTVLPPFLFSPLLGRLCSVLTLYVPPPPPPVPAVHASRPVRFFLSLFLFVFEEDERATVAQRRTRLYGFA